MELFNRHGHLTDAALQMLATGSALTELERLEIAEHLDFCDECLMRSMEVFPENALLAPKQSCQSTLWSKIRARTVRIFTSRYATAAAAVAIAITLWNFGLFDNMVDNSSRLTQRQDSLSQQLTEMTLSISDGLHHFGDLFNFGAYEAPHIHPQGGTNS